MIFRIGHRKAPENEFETFLSCHIGEVEVQAIKMMVTLQSWKHNARY